MNPIATSVNNPQPSSSLEKDVKKTQPAKNSSENTTWNKRITSPLEDLPPEMLVNIGRYLDLQSTINASLSSKKTYNNRNFINGYMINRFFNDRQYSDFTKFLDEYYSSNILCEPEKLKAVGQHLFTSSSKRLTEHLAFFLSLLNEQHPLRTAALFDWLSENELIKPEFLRLAANHDQQAPLFFIKEINTFAQSNLFSLAFYDCRKLPEVDACILRKTQLVNNSQNNNCVICSLPNNLIVTGCSNTVKIWDIQNIKEPEMIAEKEVKTRLNDLVISHIFPMGDTEFIVSFSNTKKLGIFSYNQDAKNTIKIDFNTIETDETNNLITCFSLPKNQIALADKSQRLTLLHSNPGTTVSTIKGTNDNEFSCSFTKLHNHQIARIYGKNTIEIWDFSNPSKSILAEKINADQFNHDVELTAINGLSGEMLAIGFCDGKVLVIGKNDKLNYQEIYSCSLDDRIIKSIHLLPNGSLLVNSNTMYILRLKRMPEVKVYKFPNEGVRPVESIYVNDANGQIAASYGAKFGGWKSDKPIGIWDLYYQVDKENIPKEFQALPSLIAPFQLTETTDE